MNKTQIEWVKNPDGGQGYTLNSKTGCLNHTPEGLCLGGMFPCYAFRLANGRLRGRYIANRNIAIKNSTPYGIDIISQDPFYPRFWSERLKQIKAIKKPSGIFLDNMSDWMGSYWPEEWTEQELLVMRDCPQHRFYTLTKQSQNLPRWSPFPKNCYVGVTATNPLMTRDACYWLREIETTKRFISFEPLLDDVAHIFFPEYVNQVIIGACTGTPNDLKSLAMQYPELRPMPYGKKWTLQPPIEYVKEIVEAADKVGAPVFLKDNLKPLLVKVKDSNEYAPLWANGDYGTLRQEMPK